MRKEGSGAMRMQGGADGYRLHVRQQETRALVCSLLHVRGWAAEGLLWHPQIQGLEPDMNSVKKLDKGKETRPREGRGSRVSASPVFNPPSHIAAYVHQNNSS